jgi:hypothetical protein
MERLRASSTATSAHGELGLQAVTRTALCDGRSERNDSPEGSDRNGYGEDAVNDRRFGRNSSSDE